jgi:hypothetical protein
MSDESKPKPPFTFNDGLNTRVLPSAPAQALPGQAALVDVNITQMSRTLMADARIKADREEAKRKAEEEHVELLTRRADATEEFVRRHQVACGEKFVVGVLKGAAVTAGVAAIAWGVTTAVRAHREPRREMEQGKRHVRR